MAKGDNFGLPKGLTNGALTAFESLVKGSNDFIDFVKARQTSKEADPDPELTFQLQVAVSEVNDLSQRLLALENLIKKK